MPNATEDHDVGDVVTARCQFTLAGAATDPDDVTCEVRTPSGERTTADAILDTALGTGNWKASIELTEPGLWRFRFVGVGTVDAVEPGTVYARPWP